MTASAPDAWSGGRGRGAPHLVPTRPAAAGEPAYLSVASVKPFLASLCLGLGWGVEAIIAAAGAGRGDTDPRSE